MNRFISAPHTCPDGWIQTGVRCGKAESACRTAEYSNAPERPSTGDFQPPAGRSITLARVGRTDFGVAATRPAELQLFQMSSGDAEVAMARTSVLATATRVEADASHHDALARTGRMAVEDVQVVLRSADGSELVLPTELVRVLIASAGELATGRAITVLASEAQLTPAEAAELLGLSRPFVARLLDSGDIPSERLPESRHRVVRLADVLAFQERRARRRQGRQRIAEVLDDTDPPH
jgi:excisionase family DNA binding protein